MQQPVLYLIAANDAQLRAIAPSEDLKTAQELQRLRDLLRGSELAGRLDAQYTKITEPQEMLQTLRKYAQRLQIVHFMGHAAPDGLWMHAPDGSAQFVAADYLRTALGDLPALQLVILNGCNSRNIGAAWEGEPPFALIGTTRPITDSTAMAFTAALYDGLLAGEPLGTAFEKAHKTVKITDSATVGETSSVLRWDPEWDEQPVYVLFADEILRNWRLPTYRPDAPETRFFGNAVYPQHFVGRGKELRALHKHLGIGDNALLLGGMGGIGKTTLARYYWHHPTHAYATQIWLSAASGLSQAFTDNFALLDFLGIAERMDILRRMNTSAADLRNIVWTALQAQERPILLVIDNLNEAEDRAVLRELTQLHHHDRLHLIYTSRQDAPHTTPIRIDVLPPHEALALFYEHYALERNDSLAQNLLHTIGGHTLLIELLAKTASEASWPLTELVARLQARGWDVTTDYEVDTEYTPIAVSNIKAFVRTLFDFTHLTETETEYLRYLSVFPTEPIVIETLTALCLPPDPTPDDTDRLHGTLVRLSKRSLVNTTPDHRNFWLHPVLAELLREKTEPDLENCGMVIKNLANALYSDSINDPHSYQPFITIAIVFLIYTNSKEEIIAIIYNNLGICLMNLGQLQESLKCHQQALSIRKTLWESTNPNYPTLAKSYANVGISYHAIGDLEMGIKYKEISLKILESISSPLDLDLATSYNNIGTSYHALGNIEKGLEYKLKALDIRRIALPHYDNHVATSYNNVGNSFSAIGDERKGLEYKEIALEIWEKILQDTHPALAKSYSNVGVSYAKLEDFSTALVYASKAFDIISSRYPQTHPLYIQYQNNCDALRAEMEQEQAS